VAEFLNFIHIQHNISDFRLQNFLYCLSFVFIYFYYHSSFLSLLRFPYFGCFLLSLCLILHDLLEYVVDHVILTVSTWISFCIPQNAKYCCLFTLQQNFYKYERFFIILVMMMKPALDGSINLSDTAFRHQQPFLLSIWFWKLLETVLWKSKFCEWSVTSHGLVFCNLLKQKKLCC
jgi:hypothetical protein